MCRRVTQGKKHNLRVVPRFFVFFCNPTMIGVHRRTNKGVVLQTSLTTSIRSCSGALLRYSPTAQVNRYTRFVMSTGCRMARRNSWWRTRQTFGRSACVPSTYLRPIQYSYCISRTFVYVVNHQPGLREETVIMDVPLPHS